MIIYACLFENRLMNWIFYIVTEYNISLFLSFTCQIQSCNWELFNENNMNTLNIWVRFLYKIIAFYAFSFKMSTLNLNTVKFYVKCITTIGHFQLGNSIMIIQQSACKTIVKCEWTT